MKLEIEKWKKLETNDEILKSSLVENKIESSAFDGQLSFGTAGLRGVMSAGSKRINEFTISAASRAYAEFLLKKYKTTKNKSIVVANDNRENGKLFREVVIKSMNSYGIKVFALDNNEIMATPLLSYLIRELGVLGGVNITASHNPKEYNGFKVYNKDGAQLMPEDANVISEIMSNTDIFETKYGTNEFEIIPETLLDEYILKLNALSLNEIKDVKVAFSPLHGTGYKIGDELLKSLNINYVTEGKQMEVRGDFKFTKSPNPEEVKSYDRVLKLARKSKSDIAILTDPDADRVGLVAKYKRRWKYISGNQLATVYLDYKLSQLKEKGELPKDGYIVKSLVSTDLASKIAKKYGVEVVDVHVGFKNIADVIQNKKGTFLFGFEESYGMVIDKNLTRDKDAFQGVIAAIDVASHLKQHNSNIFKRLREIYDEYGICRNIQINKKIDDSATRRLFKNIKSLKVIGDKKIIKIIDYRKLKENSANMVSIYLEGGSKIIIRPSGTEPKLKIYVQSVGTIGEERMKVVIFEKQVEDAINDVTEEFPDKKFSWKTVIKYSIFSIIMALTLFFVFKVIYGSSVSGGDTFSVAKKIFTSNGRWIFLVWMLSWFFPLLLHSFQKKRLINVQGEDVKWRHLVISGIMGRFISWITPFAVGGDAMGYWYLRRKGVKRKPLASASLMATVFYQVNLLLVSAILLPMGITMFHDELVNGGVEMKVLISLFIFGVAWDVFATFMILMLTFNKTFQEWIVRTTIKILEWIPFIRVQDPGRMASSYQHGFYDIRMGMKALWNRKLILLETFFYEFITSFVSIGILACVFLVQLKSDLDYGPYWTQIIVGDISRAANSYSITPGGSGTKEYINLTLGKILWNGVDGHPAKTTVTGIDFIAKLTAEWPILIISATTILIIVFGESRQKVHKRRNKNNKLQGNSTRTKTSFYKKTFWIYIVMGITYLTLLFALFR